MRTRRGKPRVDNEPGMICRLAEMYSDRTIKTDRHAIYTVSAKSTCILSLLFSTLAVLPVRRP